MPVDENDILRVSCRQTYLGTNEVVNVFHFVCLTNLAADDQETGEDLAAQMSLAYAELGNTIADDTKPNVIDIYNVTQDYPLGSFNWTSEWEGGTGIGEPAPTGVCALILWNTNTKRMQGKTYIGVLTEGGITGGLLSGSTTTAVGNFADVLMGPITGDSGSTYQFEVYSPTNGIVRHPIGYRIPTEPAYQRRRKRGRGS
jgi:hypothetical protein